MEAKAPGADEKISYERDQEYGIMAVPSTALDTQIGKVHEPQIRQCIYDLCDVE